MIPSGLNVMSFCKRLAGIYYNIEPASGDVRLTAARAAAVFWCTARDLQRLYQEPNP